jgi:hypothetical protein
MTVPISEINYPKRLTNNQEMFDRIVADGEIRQPILLKGRRLIDGLTRLKAAMHLGHTEIVARVQ